MVDKVLTEAKKWNGYLEKKNNNFLEEFTKNAGYNNYTIFAKKYYEYFKVNFQAQPWCAMYVSCVFREALGKTTQEKIMPHFAYCPTGVNQFKKMGCWHKSNPKKGDVIFFKDSSGLSCHVGIVLDVTSDKVHTIEGNTSSTQGVVANGGSVCKKQYSKTNSRILGYGRPNYTKLIDKPWQEEYLDNLEKRGVIQNRSQWSQYLEPVNKSLCVALIDKITGGTWASEEANPAIHWVQPHVISLCGKGIVMNKEDWLTSPDENVSKALVLALIDKATGGVKEQYRNVTYDHWARANLNSLCDKKIIDTPEVWCNDFEGEINKGNFMALVCKAFKM